MTTPTDKPESTPRSTHASNYQKPRLTRFGKVRELTAGGTGMMQEGGPMGMGMGNLLDPNRNKP